MRSLRLRLLLLLGAAIIAATVLQFATAVRAATQQANKLFDYHMQQMALALQDSAFQDTNWYAQPNADDDNFDFVVQIWTDDGVRVYQSRAYRSLPERGELGYSTVTLDNGDWRNYVTMTEHRVIQVSQKTDTRRERAISLALRSVWPIIPVALLLFAAAWWVVTTALQPLTRIGHELSHRSADSLEPVSDDGVPQEVSVLVGELNSLLIRMAQALRSQQHFVADAAHELRTPLTALKLQVQTLARTKDESSRQQAVARLQGGVDRASHLLEQLLALARQDPLAEPAEQSIVALADCADHAIADVAPLASSRHVALQFGTRADASVAGSPENLRIMIRNLLDNAVRYTPDGGKVRIDISSSDDACTLSIQDSGPGIPAPNRARVFDRFYRLPGTSQNGSGLGLAIVKTIAEHHKATIELHDASLGGLEVRITFPLAPSAKA
ncbi:ATP-binding protein [Noviherbaspirillum agri]